MDMASFIALLFAKNMALLPLGEPKNELATLALCRLRRLRRSLRELEQYLQNCLNYEADGKNLTILHFSGRRLFLL